jgi:hypothetical protein
MTIDHDAKCSRCGKGFAAGETRFVGYDGEGETPRIEHKACQAETAREWIRSESKRLLADYQPPEVNAMTDPQSLPVELPPLPPSALAVNSMFGSAHLIHADACREYARAYATACVLAERTKWIGYHIAMSGVKRGKSLTLDDEMWKMAEMVNAEIRARKP